MSSKKKSGMPPLPAPEIRHPIPAEQREIKKQQESIEQIPPQSDPGPEIPETPPELNPKKDDRQ